MTGFDIGVISIISVFSLIGLFRGLIKELFGIIWQIGGFFLASKYAYETGMFVSNNIISIENTSRISVVGFFAIFISFSIILFLIRSIIIKFIQTIKIGMLDKLLGMVFGGGKIFIVFSLIYFGIYSLGIKEINDTIDEKLKESKLSEPLLHTGEFLINSENGKKIKEKIISSVKEKKEEIIGNIKENNITVIKEKIKEKNISEYLKENLDIEDLKRNFNSKELGDFKKQLYNGEIDLESINKLLNESN